MCLSHFNDFSLLTKLDILHLARHQGTNSEIRSSIQLPLGSCHLCFHSQPDRIWLNEDKILSTDNVILKKSLNKYVSVRKLPQTN